MKSVFALVLNFFTVTAFAFNLTPSGISTNSEGSVNSLHDQQFQALKRKLLPNWSKSSELSQEDLDHALRFIQTQIQLLKSSAQLNKKVNLIRMHGYSDERASKSGEKATGEGADLLAPLLLAEIEVQKLQRDLSKLSSTDVSSRLDTIFLFVAAGYTVYPEKITTSLTERIRNITENFFEFPLDDSNQVQASNLLKPTSRTEPEFYTQQELSLLRKSLDPSTLNPPSSAIWKNNLVEEFDPADELFIGERLFPDRSIEVPDFHYERMGNGQVKFKAEFFDQFDLKKDGTPKKKDITIRTGWEAYTTTVVHQLARALGYHAIPTTFRRKIKLHLGDTSIEEFIAAYRRVHSNEQGSFTNVVELIPNENAVFIHNAALEAYPDEDVYKKMGPFRMGSNGLKNRREYRALVLFNTLISLQDHFEYQARVDAWKNPVSNHWEPIFFLADTSSALGLPGVIGNKGTVNEFTWRASRIDQGSNPKLQLFWFSFFDSRTWDNVTISDLRWLGRRLARLSDKQIEQIVMNSGFPKPVQALYIEKLKSRINHLLSDLGLSDLRTPHTVRSKSELHAEFPGVIDQDGFLKPTAQELPGNTYPILGHRFTAPQAIKVKATEALQNFALNVLNPFQYLKGESGIVDLGCQLSDGGEIFCAKRRVTVNHNVSEIQKRYLVTDQVTMALPFGKVSENVKTPFTLYRLFGYQHISSVSTVNDLAKKKFFSLLNPFHVSELRENLQLGEQLIVTEGLGASIGHAGYKSTDDLEIEATLLGIERKSLKSIHFSKVNSQVLEVIINKRRSLAIGSQLTLKALLNIGLGWSWEKSNEKTQLYRLFSLEPQQRTEFESAFDLALKENDFSKLDQILTPITLNEDSRKTMSNLSLGLAGAIFSQSASALEFQNKRFAYANQFFSTDRAFDRLWSPQFNPKQLEAPINYFGNFFNEGLAFDYAFEGRLAQSNDAFENSQFKIRVEMVDNLAHRDEFENEIKPFFAKRSGEASYIEFQMPAELKQYPLFSAQMYWQISHQGLLQILKRASNANELSRLNLNFVSIQGSESENIEQARWELVRKVRWIIPFLQTPGSLSAANDPLESNAQKGAALSNSQVRAIARQVVEVMTQLGGDRGENLSILREWAQDENLWVITSLRNVLDLSHPTFRTDTGDYFWAPEIGRHQGFSDLEKFWINHSLKPTLEKDKQ